MAWWHQATSHYLTQCWPWPRFMSPDGTTGSQWVNILIFSILLNTEKLPTVEILHHKRPGACPINSISIEFKIWSKFAVLWFKIWSTDHNNIFHMSRVLLSWCVQNFVVIGWIYYEQEYYKFLLNFKFDQNIISGTGARTHFNTT